MTYSRRFRQFTRDEHGAATVDWVVITASVVGFGVMVVASVQNAALDQSRGIGAGVISTGSHALNPTLYP